MIVVTSGAPYIDIDAYAGCIAYAELLKLSGREAVAATTSALNASITPTLRSLHARIETGYTSTSQDTFILVDISEEAFFDPIVDHQKIIEIVDHHPGFETYWQGKSAVKCTIESVGAAATLVYEKWAQQDKLGQLTSAVAQLLAAAILDNTLNFRAAITTDRDKAAFEQLAKIAKIDKGWVAAYFEECQQNILNNLSSSLKDDTKLYTSSHLSSPLQFAQLVVWNAGALDPDEVVAINHSVEGSNPLRVTNIVSIEEGRSYFLSDSSEVQTWLSDIVGVTFNGTRAQADRLWLRKEVAKADQTKQ